MHDINEQQNLEIPEIKTEISEANVEVSEQEGTQRFRKKTSPVPLFKVLSWSILVSLFSVVNPLLTNLATNLQSQNLYAGWAMAQGQTIYSHIYGTSGLLYYLINWAGSIAFGQILFLIFQVLALVLAGVYLFKTISYITTNSSLAQNLLPLFYLLTATLGFGGLYSSIFVFPFVFWSMYFLVRYVQNAVKDEVFILYGAVGALSFLVEPMLSIVFYTLAGLVLFAYNIASKRKARGLYQCLAVLLGFSLLFYPLGYYTVWNGSFGVAISQVTYAIDAFKLTGSQLPSNALYYGLLTIGLGFVTAFVLGFQFKKEAAVVRLMRILSLFGFLTVFIGALGLPEQGAYQLLPALPFVIILFALWFNKNGETSVENEGRRRRERHKTSVWNRYFSKQVFLPLVGMIYLIGFPFVQEYILSNGVSGERAIAARYIRENSSAKDTIYAWDNTASLYQQSQRLSAVSILTPSLYTGTDENQIYLRNTLNQVEPKFILVNNHIQLLPDVDTKISKNYKETNLKLSHFKLYQLQ